MEKIMREVPVDAAALLAPVDVVIGIDEVLETDESGNPTGQQRLTNDGVPKWKLVLSARNGRGKRELIEIGFAAAEAPEYGPKDLPHFRNLKAMHWHMGNNAGLALTAEAVAFKPAAGNAPSKPTESA